MKITGIKMSINLGEFNSNNTHNHGPNTTVNDTNVKDVSAQFEIGSLELTSEELIQLVMETGTNVVEKFKTIAQSGDLTIEKIEGDVDDQTQNEIAATMISSECKTYNHLYDLDTMIEKEQKRHELVNCINAVLDRCTKKEPAFTDLMAIKIRTKILKITDCDKLAELYTDVLELENIIIDSKIVFSTICGNDIESKSVNYTSKFSNMLSNINFKYQ